MTLVFIGDSITEDGRRRDDPQDLGVGYVSRVAAQRRAVGVEERIVNSGVGGDRAIDLVERWERDCLAHEPELVSIHVGINDTWRRYDGGEATSTEDFAERYRALLERTAPTGARLVLIEPFLLALTPEQAGWREDLDPKIQVVRRLAESYGLPLVATDGPFAQAVATSGLGPQAWAYDGVHPTPAGHDLLAEAWLKVVHLR